MNRLSWSQWSAPLQDFQGDACERLSTEDAEWISGLPQLHDMLLLFLAFDWVAGGSPSLGARLLQRKSTGLSKGARYYLEQLRDAPVMLYEALAILPDGNIEIRPWETDERYTLKKPYSWYNATPGSAAGARLLHGANGSLELSEPLCEFPKHDAPKVYVELQDALAQADASRGPTHLEDRRKLDRELTSRFLHTRWLAATPDRLREAGECWRITSNETPYEALLSAFPLTAENVGLPRLHAETQFTLQYETWCSAALPELDGHSPREATALTGQRGKLLALLRNEDRRAARAASTGTPVGLDCTGLWELLELTAEREETHRRAVPDAAAGDEPEKADQRELGRMLNGARSWPTMDISMLDGFLTGVASSPKHIPEVVWLRTVLFSITPPEPHDGGRSVGEHTLMRAIALVRRHADDLVRRLTLGNAHPILHDRAPLGMVSRATPWAVGFSMAMRFEADAWMELVRRQPITLIFDGFSSLLSASAVDAQTLRKWIENHANNLAHDLFLAARDPRRLGILH